MKTKLLIIPAFGAALFLGVLACKKSMDDSAAAKQSTARSKSQLEESGLPLPDGTIFTENKNGSGEVISIYFTLPEGSTIYGTSADGLPVSGSGGNNLHLYGKRWMQTICSRG